MSIKPLRAHLIEPEKPMTKATTSSVALATRLDAPTTYIIPGTPTKPPTAIVAAIKPVQNPTGTVNQTEILTFAVFR